MVSQRPIERVGGRKVIMQRQRVNVRWKGQDNLLLCTAHRHTFALLRTSYCRAHGYWLAEFESSKIGKVNPSFTFCINIGRKCPAVRGKMGTNPPIHDRFLGKNLSFSSQPLSSTDRLTVVPSTWGCPIIEHAPRQGGRTTIRPLLLPELSYYTLTMKKKRRRERQSGKKRA